jgi:hypothetical protein
MPMRSQREARDLLQKGVLSEDHHLLYQSALKAAGRVGLLVTGGVRTALSAFATFEADLQGIDIHNEQGFAEACRRSAYFTDAINFALSTTFLASRSR